jgi:hypothetical protein
MSDWERLAPLPRVAAWNRGRRARNWESRRDACAALVGAPLLVRATLATPLVLSADGLPLDGLLSWAALTAHPVASDFDGAAVVPLPLRLQWVSETGQPLWCASALLPDGDGAPVAEYWHKRYPTHRAEFGVRMNADTQAGRWREYRVPLRVRAAVALSAICIGDRAEVERLLAVVTHVGKKGSMGYGRVANWSVAEADHAADDVLARRPLPDAYIGAKGGALRGWTPPYWYAPWWAACGGLAP